MAVVFPLNNFNLFCLNIRSLRAHFDELVVYLNSLSISYDILVLTEVWIKSGEEHRYHLPGYNMLFQPRPDNQAGGVVIYVTSGLDHQHTNILYPTAELINVNFSLIYHNRSVSFSLFGIYRQNKFTFKQFKNDFYNILQKSVDPTIIVGDMNICLLKNKGSKKDYLSLISSFGFESLLNEPTRDFNNSVSCIDHLLVRNSKELKFESNVVKIDITDHYAIELSLSSIKNISKQFNFCKVLDRKMLHRQLSLANWTSVFNEQNVNCCVSNFYKVYNQCNFNSCTLKKLNSKNRKRSEWVTDNLIEIINRKNNLFKLFIKNRDNLEVKTRYKNCSRTVARLIKKAKLSFYSNEINKCQGDSKKYWNVIKKIVKSKKKVLNYINIKGELVQVVNNEKSVANEFNSYFADVIPRLRLEAFGHDLFPENNEYHGVALQNFECSLDEIVNAIKRMKNKYSCGTDGIDVFVLKDNIDVFAKILLNIFQKSLAYGIFPDYFKIATVVPVYKSGRDDEVCSYRPISVINTIAKVFETCIKNKLMNYFEERNLFSHNQFGFLPGKGTDIAIAKHVDSITCSVNKHKYTLSMYLDFQKAFDFLDINILVNKLKQYGIGGNALLWLESFCRGRKQAVKINNILGDVLELFYGTPQGGVMGPVLFLIYINDLLNLDLHSSVFAYADDTALVCSAFNRESLNKKINNDLNKISNWLINNRLLINAEKTKCIMFFDTDVCKNELRNLFNLYCHKHLCVYNCNCTNIEIVEFVKYLGIFVDQRLKWNHHCNFLSTKLRKINYALYHIRNFLTSNNLKQLYLSWFQSTLSYGIIHFGGSFVSVLKPLIMCQRNALRTIYNIKRMEQMSYLFSEKSILTFEQIFIYNLIMHVHKYLDEFPLRQVVRVTRSAQHFSLELPFFVKESGKHQLCYLGPKYFNTFVQLFGNEIVFEKKPRVKLKVMQFVKEL